MRQAIAQQAEMTKLELYIYQKCQVQEMEHKCAKKEKYKNSPQANSLLPPQHRRCRRRHLIEVLLSRPPLGDLSSPKEVDEPRSPKKRLGRPISRRS